MAEKPIIWVGSSKSDLLSLPDGVKDEIGYALHQAQRGGKSEKAKPFKGFGSAAVLEIVEYNLGGTYRAVYTVKFEKAIAVLHVRLSVCFLRLFCQISRPFLGLLVKYALRNGLEI